MTCLLVQGCWQSVRSSSLPLLQLDMKHPRNLQPTVRRRNQFHPSQRITEERLFPVIVHQLDLEDQKFVVIIAKSLVISVLIVHEGVKPLDALEIPVLMHAKAVGPLLELEVCIEGVPIIAMVDTGAQSTIISRSTLHAVTERLRQQGRSLPELEIPSVRLYGKDGERGGKALPITAQLSLTFSVDSKSVTVPVFVQPDSEQACLLGVNAIPLLSISVIRCNGKSILSHAPPEPDVASVKSVTFPSHKSRAVRVKVSGEAETPQDMLFEPN